MHGLLLCEPTTNLLLNRRSRTRETIKHNLYLPCAWWSPETHLYYKHQLELESRFCCISHVNNFNGVPNWGNSFRVTDVWGSFGLCQNERENERLDRWALSLGNLSLISNRNSRPFPCDFWDITGPNSWFYFYGMWVFKCWRRPVANFPFKRMSSLFNLQDENIDHFPSGKFKSMQNITFHISKTII